MAGGLHVKEIGPDKKVFHWVIAEKDVRMRRFWDADIFLKDGFPEISTSQIHLKAPSPQLLLQVQHIHYNFSPVNILSLISYQSFIIF